MRVPRDLTGADISRALRVLGYEKVRQEGSHFRLTTMLNGVHHITVPNHSPLKIGTLLGGVLKPVAAHHGLSVEELLEKIGL
jgi:predicted RNA binding protein YcfA (HicA-like mRNA interferase family)